MAEERPLIDPLQTDASMRPGQEAPDGPERSIYLAPSSPRFNEAGARSPGWPARAAWTNSTAAGFNEAGARSPGWLRAAGTTTLAKVASMRPGQEAPDGQHHGARGFYLRSSFNEAGARSPGWPVLVLTLIWGMCMASMRPGQEAPDGPPVHQTRLERAIELQ